jgi:hypothetical protein
MRTGSCQVPQHTNCRYETPLGSMGITRIVKRQVT